MIAANCLTINNDDIWEQTIGSPYKGHIYGMETTYNDSMSLASMTKAEPVTTNKEDYIRDCVHVLNESMQK